MTPEIAFKSGGRNPHTGIFTRQWYVTGSAFNPQPVEDSGEVFLGIRIVTAIDFASGYLMRTDIRPEAPEALTAFGLIPFMDEVCKQFGTPTEGWIFSHSSWYSSHEMLLDEETEQQGQFLKNNNIEFGPMSDGDKELLREWGAQRELKVYFDADRVFEGDSKLS